MRADDVVLALFGASPVVLGTVGWRIVALLQARGGEPVQARGGEPGPGCGVVDASGKLQIKTTVDTALGIDLITPGTHLQLDLARTGVRRTTGPSLPAAGTLTFSAGIMAP